MDFQFLNHFALQQKIMVYQKKCKIDKYYKKVILSFLLQPLQALLRYFLLQSLTKYNIIYKINFTNWLIYLAT